MPTNPNSNQLVTFALVSANPINPQKKNYVWAGFSPVSTALGYSANQILLMLRKSDKGEYTLVGFYNTEVGKVTLHAESMTEDTEAARWMGTQWLIDRVEGTEFFTRLLNRIVKNILHASITKKSNESCLHLGAKLEGTKPFSNAQCTDCGSTVESFLVFGNLLNRLSEVGEEMWAFKSFGGEIPAFKKKEEDAIAVKEGVAANG